MGRIRDRPDPKEVERAEDKVLFDKYQLCREIGRGRSGRVYLARHLELEEYRAIKLVHKSTMDYQQFKREALILKSIRHPGIPIVYDIEETPGDGWFGIIEEFLEGSSLYALVSDMGHLSKAMTVSYGIQICHLVIILHSARPNPILYLDLQPKNLLVCRDTIKLVDFDHAVYVDEAKELVKRYGTVGFAAPEQYTGRLLDERTDIYAIGAVLYYMLTGSFPGEHPLYPRALVDRDMGRIIKACLHPQPERRYASVDRLCQELDRIQKEIHGQRQGLFSGSRTSSLVIAVAGTSHGAGATHVAMGLAAHLQRQGLAVIYEEHNDSGGVRQFAGCTGAEADSYGTLRIAGLPMLPAYGKAVQLKPHPYPVVVKDFGTDQKTFTEEPADGFLLGATGKPWQWETAGTVIRSPGFLPGTVILYNQFCKQLSPRLPSPAKETPVFLMPHFTSPFQSTRQVQKVYDRMLAVWTEPETGGSIRVWLKKAVSYLKSIPGNLTGGP